ncbi:MAG: 50S ribosomal protein L22 [Planctomycetaceae bacterium]
MALVRAKHSFARISPTKVRPFADLIRGRAANVGLSLLRYEPNRGARMLEKVLKSAMANAEDRGARNVDNLIITDARVDQGPMFKRIRPMSRGMAYLIRRRFAHIHVGIEAPELT